MKKLGLGILYGTQTEPAEQLKVFKRIGFDAFFSSYRINDTELMKKTADELGLEYQSIHAPFYEMDSMWYEDERTESAKAELIDCARECARYSVPLMIVHPFITFERNEPTEAGIKNFREVVDAARGLGVKIAFENVEGDRYLAALMEAFRTCENVGFCWDTGHELCYNRSEDMLALYGDRLFGTHINDNLGVLGDEITFRDDLHLLPFDGKKDWHDAMARLCRTGFDGVMTFELKQSKAIDEKFGTHYCEMDFEDYIRTAYERAVRLRELLEGCKKA